MPGEIKSCCFTGYRPSKFPFKMDDAEPEFKKLENKLIDAVFSAADEGCYTFYCGMAMGFDLIAARAVLMLKEVYNKASISLVCAIPFVDQAEKFDEKWHKMYNEIISFADNVILISDNYFNGVYQKRNEFMVDNSDYVITWYNGLSGGTKNTLKYARRKGKKIVNLFEDGVHEYFAEPDYEIIALDI